MAKVSLEEVEGTLADRVDVPTKQKILKELEEVIEAHKAENADKPKAPKKQLVVVSTDPAFDTNIPLFVAEIKEDDDHNELRRNVEAAVNAFNVQLANNKRKKDKNWLRTLGDAFGVLKGKKSTEHGFSIKTPEPVIAVQIPNELSITNPESL